MYTSNAEKDLYIIAANFEENDNDNDEKDDQIEDLEKKLTKHINFTETKIITEVNRKMAGIENELSEIKSLILDQNK